MLTKSENIHLQPYTTEQDFYDRIYPKYLTLLGKAKAFMEETGATPEKTIVLIRQVIASHLRTSLTL
jgi:histone deacetylase HOS3